MCVDTDQPGSREPTGPRVVQRKNLVLMMTNRILEMAEQSGGWSEDKIRSRGEELASRACRIWTRPRTWIVRWPHSDIS